MVPGSFWRICHILSTGMKPGKGRRERERGKGKEEGDREIKRDILPVSTTIHLIVL